MWIFSKLKAYWWAIVAAVLTVLAGTVKFLLHRNSTLRDRAEYARAYATRARVSAERDNELEAQSRSHRAEVKNELEETGESRRWRDPDSLWDDDPD